jgi:hypothetical protein
MPDLPQSRRHFLTSAAFVGASAALPAISRPHNFAERTTFVLVHGAWHGGWCWRRVADRLTASGHYVVAPTLSGVGERSHLASDAITLSTQIDDVVNEIKWKDLDHVVLVGHSYGGMVITGSPSACEAGLRDRRYLDACIPLMDNLLHASQCDGGSILRARTVPAPPAAYFKVNEKASARGSPARSRRILRSVSQKHFA